MKKQILSVLSIAVMLVVLYGCGKRTAVDEVEAASAVAEEVTPAPVKASPIPTPDTATKETEELVKKIVAEQFIYESDSFCSEKQAYVKSAEVTFSLSERDDLVMQISMVCDNADGDGRQGHMFVKNNTFLYSRETALKRALLRGSIEKCQKEGYSGEFRGSTLAGTYVLENKRPKLEYEIRVICK